MQPSDFPQVFATLTGSPPFPWQSALYADFVSGRFHSSINLPTGLGKTSIVAIWLCALATKPHAIPRRLIYVVNRRTVVDQTTSEVEKWRKRLEAAGIASSLSPLCAVPLAPEDSPLAISTLRGQFADNRVWSSDPARPSVIVGTVDMIGSGLLFSRYTVGFKLRPHHAALLAQDALIVHDEAHLEPAFQKLLESIVAVQRAFADPRKLRVIALTATSRAANPNTSSTKPFGLDENPNEKDTDNKTVQERYHAVKRLSSVALGDEEKLDAKLVALAKEKSSGRAVLVFARSVEIVLKVAAELGKGDTKRNVATLTGTMRGKERDELSAGNAVFQRFLPEKDRAQGVEPATGTVFLIATSAGEVGVNLSADDIVCDLSTYESMVQRFGRVNRFGHRDDSTISIVHETEFDTAKPLEAARKNTLALLQKLDGTASPAALDGLSKRLPDAERVAAFSPLPDMRTATDIQFDAWALTTIREPIAARPPIAPYLHGEAEWQPPETLLAWRDDRDFRHITDPEAFLEAFPLRPQELLRDTSNRIASKLEKLLTPGVELPEAWLVSDGGAISRFSLADFDRDAAETLLADAILILPASVGGLENGLFTEKADGPATDVSDIERRETDSRDAIPENCKLVHSVEISEEGADEQRFLFWCQTMTAKTSSAAANRAANRGKPDTLAAHTLAVEGHARALAEKLLPAPAAGEPDLRRCLILAATLHDSGKNRAQWQRNLGNRGRLGIPDYDPTKPETILAKSVAGMRPRAIAEHYRHEFGSLNDASTVVGLSDLSDLERDIVLHLAAAHHGRARPHFPEDEILDYHPAISPEKSVALATEVPRRFARLQRRFGRWGLAWLESLLRAADYAASAGIVAQSGAAISVQAGTPSQTGQSTSTPQPAPTATLAVNPANPGHYFACCGLFELAARLSPDALAWFDQDSATRQWSFHLANTPPLVDLLGKITAAEISAEEDEPEDENDADEDAGEKESEKEASAPPLRIGEPFDLRLDWWTTASPSTSALKVWAGSMKVRRIAISMRHTIQEIVKTSCGDLGGILFEARVSLDPFKIKKAEEKSAAQYEADLKAAYAKRDEASIKAVAEKTGEKLEKEKTKIEAKYSEACVKAVKKRDDNIEKAQAKGKTEPFYFDANRGPNSDARDVGFSPNDLKLRTLAAPAAEFLTLAGLQRAIPQPSGDRLFDYHLWQKSIPIALLAAAINGLTEPRPKSLRFESWYRTSQRKHKAFLPARPR